MKEESTQEMLERINREEEREALFQEFMKGPTNGSLNDKRRMGEIFQLLLVIKDILEQK